MKSIYLDDKAMQFYNQAVVYQEKAKNSFWPISYFYRLTARTHEENANIIEATRLLREEAACLSEEAVLLEFNKREKEKEIKNRFERFALDHELLKIQLGMNPHTQKLLDGKMVKGIDEYIKKKRDG